MTRAWRCAILVVAVLIGGCGPSEKEKRNVSEFTSAMRTYCVGRHLVDLPSSFRPIYRGSSATLYFGRDENFEKVEVQVVAESVKPEQFEAAVKQRAADIAAEKNESTKKSMLLLQERVGEQGILLRYHKSDISNRSHIHELHALVSGIQLFVKQESYEGAFEPVETRLKKLVSQVRAVTDPQRAGAGFCLGPLLIDADNDFEVASFHFRDGDQKHRDVSLSFDLNTFKQDESEPRLIKRAAANFSALGFKPDVLREDKVEFAGMPAEEWGASHTGDGRTEHVFNIESYPATAALGTPVLQMQMETGGAIPRLPTSGLRPYLPADDAVELASAEVSSSLSDAAAMGLWDAVIKTARLRPGAVKQP